MGFQKIYVDNDGDKILIRPSTAGNVTICIKSGDSTLEVVIQESHVVQFLSWFKDVAAESSKKAKTDDGE